MPVNEKPSPLQGKTMSRAAAKEAAKLALGWYLKDALRIDINQNFSCLNPEHPDMNPSASYDKVRHKVHCFGCGADMDIFDCVAAVEELEDPAAAFDLTYEILGVTIDNTAGSTYDDVAAYLPDVISEEPPAHDFTDYLHECHANLPTHQPAADYLHGRGLTDESIARFGLGYDKSADAVTIPYNAAGTYFMRRGLEGAHVKHQKPTKDEAGDEPVFNVAALYANDAVYVVEAPICAISIEQEGAAAVAIGGTGGGKLMSQLERRTTTATLILSLDNDDAGRKAQKKLVDTLTAAGIRFVEHNAAGEHKDPNACLQADPDAFRAAVWAGKEKATTEREEAAERYHQAFNAAAHLPGFIDRVHTSATTSATPTGFSMLDELLDGGLYAGLYVLGAISSLGKTTFILQAADQIARQGRDVLIISLEMSRDELLAKSISRNTLIQCQRTGSPAMFAKTTRKILTGKFYKAYNPEELNTINAATEDYATYADHVYIVEGAGAVGVKQVRQLVDQHARLTGNRPVLIIDYLQILAPHDARATDKQNTDFSVVELKRISRDYNTPVLAISSFNRENYNTTINMSAFKESGSVEYSSDVLIGLQLKGVGPKDFDVEAAKAADPRKIELKVLKNRNGKTGMVDYSFYPAFNYFEEPGDRSKKQWIENKVDARLGR